MRGVLRPIGDAVGFSCVVGTFDSSLGSLGHKLQGMRETTFGQLHLEAILALRLRITQRRIGRFPEEGICRRLIR
jgi:hypothetical protein